MTRVVVLGAGVMGTAFTLPFSDKGMTVDLVGTHLDVALVEAMCATRIHPRLKAPIGERVTPHHSTALASVLADPPDLLVLGVSTPGIGWAIGQLARHLRGTPPVLLLTKGIDELPDSVGILPHRVVRDLAAAGVACGPVGAVGGPCIAGELAVRRPTSAILGFADGRMAKGWAERIGTGYYHLASTGDLIGLEICAALKNFYAIGVSVPSGRLAADPAPNLAGLHNETASLFNQAVSELSLIVEISGGEARSAYGLAGLGDLHVTTQAGRNSKLGRLLGEGLSYEGAMQGPLAGETVEGALVARSLRAPLLEFAGGHLSERLPLATAIIRTVADGAPFHADIAAFHKG